MSDTQSLARLLLGQPSQVDGLSNFIARHLPNGPAPTGPMGESVGPQGDGTFDPIVGRDQFTGRLQTASQRAAQARRAELATILALGFVGGSDVVPPGGIRAFHGSPHSFDAFDASKIGTGEGAQAFGHGLYFAGNEGVARSYKDKLGGMDWKFSPANSAEQSAADAVKRYLDDVGWDDATGVVRSLSYDAPEHVEVFQNMLNAGRAIPTQGGHMYEVNLNTSPNRLLDWDKPLSEQPQAVRDALASYRLPTSATGKDALAAVAETLSPQTDAFAKLFGHTSDAGRVAASDALKKAGIDGIQYLDGGSRVAGEGSRNYVMFDPAKIDLIRKYGIAGLGMSSVLAGAGGTQGGAQ